MPIKKENRSIYPPNWREIRDQILERAGHRCEGSPDFPNCRAPHGWFKHKETQVLSNDPVIAQQWQQDGGVTTIVLTVAHLDHDPSNCAPDNLRAWCQRCHLHYDRHLHATNARKTRHSKKAVAELWQEP